MSCSTAPADLVGPLPSSSSSSSSFSPPWPAAASSPPLGSGVPVPPSACADPLSIPELTAWLRLAAVRGVGPAGVRRLLAAFGSPEAVWAAPAAAHRAAVGAAAAAALAQASLPDAQGLATRTADWVAAAPAGVQRAVVPLGDPRYPEPLLHIADPPLVLHAEGQLHLLGRPGVAIVGSRHATPQGLATARDLAAGLAGAGFVVVSGLAHGIDAAAHDGALAHPAGTVGVLGTGLDLVYPRHHVRLAERMRAGGLLVSEYPLGSPPLREHFPQRNRLIAGLTRATLVVEAALASGSLITARLAAEGGRDVLAVPGSIHSPQSRGCHVLLKQGAGLVETAQDVLDALGWGVVAVPSMKATTAGPAEAGDPPVQPGDVDDDGAEAAGVDPVPDPLLAALGYGPTDLDTLLAATGWAAPALSARLLDLELSGRVARLPGQRFQRLPGT